MKNALILHGTNGEPSAHWFPWLKARLEEKGYQAWVPQLPDCEKPNVQKYNDHIFANKNFQINNETVLVGHSSGAVAILGLLQALPEGIIVNTCILVGSFKDNLNRKDLEDLFLKPFNFNVIKQRSKKFILFHSDNDPYCPLEHAEYLAKKLDGKLIIMKGQAHFSVETMGDKYKEFPKLLEQIA